MSAKIVLTVSLALGVADVAVINLVLGPKLERELVGAGQPRVVSGGGGAGSARRPSVGVEPSAVVAGPSSKGKEAEAPPRPVSEAGVLGARHAEVAHDQEEGDRGASKVRGLASAVASTVPPASTGHDVADQQALPTLRFGQGSALLSRASRSELLDVCRRMTRDRDLRLLVRGHANASGSDEANMTMSRLRCDMVVNFLKVCGVSARRIETEALGHSEPVGQRLAGVFQEDMEASRRVELRWMK